jgi:hypothetical protein
MRLAKTSYRLPVHHRLKILGTGIRVLMALESASWNGCIGVKGSLPGSDGLIIK